MKWDNYFKGDLKYNYIRLLLKDLSPAEQYYMKVLRDGVDEQINSSINWINNNQDELQGLHTYGDWLDYYHDNSVIEEILLRLLGNNVDNSIRPLYDFYKSGGNLAYAHMNKSPSFNESDRIALKRLSDYITTVVTSINTELTVGIVDTIGKSIEEDDSMDNLISDVVDLNAKPLHTSKYAPKESSVNSLFSIDTRCLFTSKTEYARTVNTGLLQAYSNYNILEYDWVTTGLPNVCKQCHNIEAESPYALNEIINLLPVHPNCYMYDTQVFTNEGWKYFYELSSNDKMLSLNPSTYTTEFINYNKLIKTKNRFGYMYHIYNRWFDICITPDHDCFVLQRKLKNGVRDFHSEFRKVDDLNSESYFLRKVENNNTSPTYINVNGLKFKTKDYIFFMAWYISEGNVLHNKDDAKKRRYPVYINQFNEENHRLLEKELKRICEYLGITIFCGKRAFELHSKALYDYLYPLGYSHEKYLPNELFKLSKEDLNYFLDNYLKGDGNEQKKSNSMVSNGVGRAVFTSSIKLVDGLSYLILLAGYYPSIALHSKKGKVVKHRNGEYAQNHDIYRISINNSKTAMFKKCNIEKLKYDGWVYCVELPKYHTLWIRRNGKTSWNGNCQCSVKARIPNNLHLISNPQIIDLTPKEEGK